MNQEAISKDVITERFFGKHAFRLYQLLHDKYILLVTAHHNQIKQNLQWGKVSHAHNYI